MIVPENETDRKGAETPLRPFKETDSDVQPNQ